MCSLDILIPLKRWHWKHGTSHEAYDVVGSLIRASSLMCGALSAIILLRFWNFSRRTHADLLCPWINSHNTKFYFFSENIKKYKKSVKFETRGRWNNHHHRLSPHQREKQNHEHSQARGKLIWNHLKMYIESVTEAIDVTVAFADSLSRFPASIGALFLTRIKSQGRERGKASEKFW